MVGGSGREERLLWELEQLRLAGIEVEILSGSPSAPEEFRIGLRYSLDGESIALEAVFPEAYPFFRFQVFAPDLNLAHHQNPFDKNLCLFGRSTDQWSKKDTLVSVLTERLPLVLEAGAATSTDAVEEIEEQQAEPFSEYYPVAKDCILLVDGEWELPAPGQTGQLVLGFEREPPPLPLRPYVLEMRGSSGRLLHAAVPAVQDRCTCRRTGHWLSLDQPIRTSDPDEFFEEFVSRGDVRLERQGAFGGSFVVLATLFPEEHSWRETVGTGWVSLMDFRPSASRRLGRRTRGPGLTKRAFIRVGRCGPSDLGMRIPELSSLSGKKIVVLGLGCVGSTAANELAQCGIGQLVLIDGDYVDPGMTVRWPQGAQAYGMQKVEALANHIRANYPHTAVTAVNLRVGSIHGRPGTPEGDALTDAFDDASLVLDLTAEHGVQRYTSQVCRESGIPYVWAWGTRGGWGGFVGRVASPEDACWCCIETADRLGLLPWPSEDEGATIQPSGCGDPTFTGASFDMHTISMAAVRVAIATLSEGEDGYPARSTNAEVVNLRDENGHSILPHWSGLTVEKRPHCEVCGDGSDLA